MASTMQSGAKTGWLALIKETFNDWQSDRAPRLGAALSYYTIFSLAPLLLVVIAIAGLAFGQQAVQGQVVDQIRSLVGPEGAKVVQDMLAGAAKKSSGITAGVIGFVVLLFGATGVLTQLQDALDTIWNVRPAASRGFFGMLRDRWTSLAMLLGIGFLLLVSLIVSAAISGMAAVASEYLPLPPVVLQLINLVISLGVIAVLFALIFKYLPNVSISWKDVAVGALGTALLFVIGKFLIGLYLGHAAVGSVYGAAGSVVILLLWTYYSALILLFGAEFTQVYASAYGQNIVPAEGFVYDQAAEGKPGLNRRRGQQTVVLRKTPHRAAREQEHAAEPDYLQQQTTRAQEALSAVWGDLKRDAVKAADPQLWVRRYPWLAVSLCGAVGVKLGSLVHGKPKTAQAAAQAGAEEAVRRAPEGSAATVNVEEGAHRTAREASKEAGRSALQVLAHSLPGLLSTFKGPISAGLIGALSSRVSGGPSAGAGFTNGAESGSTGAYRGA